MEKQDPATDPTLEWPVDAAVERQRLLDDAAARGVDPTEWLQLAEEISTLHHPAPEDYRIVGRHLVSGFTVEAARAELEDHDAHEVPKSVGSDMVHGPDEGPLTL